MVFIGICGASGSGKTTLAKELCRAIGASSALLNQDAYYLDHPELTFEERTKLNYDEPFIFDHDLLYQDARMLMAGQSVTARHMILPSTAAPKAARSSSLPTC